MDKNVAGGPERSSIYFPHENDELANLDRFFSMTTDGDILRHFMGGCHPNAPLYLSTCAIVCLNLEWWQNKPHHTTEIGIAEFFPSIDVATIHASNHLESIRVAHARIMENAHLINTFEGAGDPNKFYFGTTKFVTMKEAREIIVNTFSRSNVVGQKQPMILLIHGKDAKLKHLMEKFDIDLLGMGTIVKTIDTQELAKHDRIPRPKGPTLSLENLASHFNVKPDNAHNAGNGAAYTMMSAILTTLKIDIYGAYLSFTIFNVPPPVVLAQDIRNVIENVKQINKIAPLVPWGQVLFCTRCNQNNHLVKHCTEKVKCKACLKSCDSGKRKAAWTHLTEKCIFEVFKAKKTTNKSTKALARPSLSVGVEKNEDDKMEMIL